MTSTFPFFQHVDYLKLDNPKLKSQKKTISPNECAPPPRPIEFRRKKPISVKVEERGSKKVAERQEAEDQEIIDVAEAKEELGVEQGMLEKELKKGEDIDWFAYWLAVRLISASNPNDSELEELTYQLFFTLVESYLYPQTPRLQNRRSYTGPCSSCRIHNQSSQISFN